LQQWQGALRATEQKNPVTVDVFVPGCGFKQVLWSHCGTPAASVRSMVVVTSKLCVQVWL
jgi:hypothetical protein